MDSAVCITITSSYYQFLSTAGYDVSHRKDDIRLADVIARYDAISGNDIRREFPIFRGFRRGTLAEVISRHDVIARNDHRARERSLRISSDQCASLSDFGLQLFKTGRSQSIVGQSPAAGGKCPAARRDISE